MTWEFVVIARTGLVTWLVCSLLLIASSYPLAAAIGAAKVDAVLSPDELQSDLNIDIVRRATESYEQSDARLLASLGICSTFISGAFLLADAREQRRER